MISELLATPWTVVPFTRIKKIRKLLRLGYFCDCYFCCLIWFSAVCLHCVGGVAKREGGKH